MKNLVKIYVATVNVFRAHSVKNFLEGTFHVGMRFKHRSTAHIRENSLWRAHFLDVEGEKVLTKIRAHMTKKCWLRYSMVIYSWTYPKAGAKQTQTLSESEKIEKKVEKSLDIGAISIILSFLGCRDLSRRNSIPDFFPFPTQLFVLSSWLCRTQPLNKFLFSEEINGRVIWQRNFLVSIIVLIFTGFSNIKIQRMFQSTEKLAWN